MQHNLMTISEQLVEQLVKQLFANFLTFSDSGSQTFNNDDGVNEWRCSITVSSPR